MTEFKPVTLADKSWMQPLIDREDCRSADFSFMNIYAWSDTYEARAAILCGCLIVRTVVDGVPAYSFPIGSENGEETGCALRQLYDYVHAAGEAFRVQSITAERLEDVERHLPCSFEIIPQTDLFDYVYSAEKLISLSGKKLHAKRNFVNRFEAENNWSFEGVNADNLAACMQMDAVWATFQEASQTISGERLAMQKAFDAYDYLGLDGGILRVNGEPVAFTIGEKLCSDTYVVHFEKSVSDLRGVYPMINREFVRHICEKYPEIRYINREEDMGLENLRKAKHSYYPDFMVEKYMAVER